MIDHHNRNWGNNTIVRLYLIRSQARERGELRGNRAGEVVALEFQRRHGSHQGESGRNRPAEQIPIGVKQIQLCQPTETSGQRAANVVVVDDQRAQSGQLTQ